jgi:hypothetical protein
MRIIKKRPVRHLGLIIAVVLPLFAVSASAPVVSSGAPVAALSALDGAPQRAALSGVAAPQGFTTLTADADATIKQACVKERSARCT